MITLKDYKIILTNVHPASAACFEAMAEKQALASEAGEKLTSKLSELY